MLPSHLVHCIKYSYNNLKDLPKTHVGLVCAFEEKFSHNKVIIWFISYFYTDPLTFIALLQKMLMISVK